MSNNPDQTPISGQASSEIGDLQTEILPELRRFLKKWDKLLEVKNGN